ncbi:uncharacterized protein FFB20_00858 [Fusarium fujikuroi]|uniref:PD-(D/E)XK nuclease-like domain-containing protein n=1 Tax=Gibberella fujikuroi (strain CBS 195.34 / IMI 58289 / NRRL A-6831) TaxID=1279085 RepID=S0ELA3_GIBF5|nr:uncharacterized protein FFUJ_11858 [Fusarium fujikuroi IMI 58289]KLP09727.1 uncharacterized protein Y057_5242 [Fusarium fujikuroi]CCT75818.1 uncharacterized protein FFUJ_11858 [Fusarium fujikuroi IMI 58289]SCN64641.1 uncharacterized protein FFB20_00858 [Fusarium fujikuroi]SCN70556.1 uncharacterized protein FFE2_02036 [Fusarium fujikuroi]SCO14506.1 uncharacterized protein FFM5_10862 [Fusarium fujikuroi]
MTTQDREITWIENLPQIYSHQLSQDIDTTASAPASPTRERKGNNSVQALDLSPLSSLSILGVNYDSPQTLAIKASSRVSSSASDRTRSTSELKRQFLELHLDERGLETKALNVDALEALLNPEAASLLRTMRRIGNCKGILPQDMRDQVLQSHSIKQDDLDDWDLAFKDSDAFAHLPGRIPSAREIELVCNWTTDCIDSKHEEAGWSDEVHFPIQPVHTSTGFRANTSTAKSYEDSCRTTPNRCVNHTDFQRLQTHPIVLSIETKAGSISDAAELQMGVWHTAQWAFLKSSLSRAQDGA